MTSRLRGSAKDEEPRTVSLSTSKSKSRTYLNSVREPRSKSDRFEGSISNRVSRKDSKGKYEQDYQNDGMKRKEYGRSYDTTNGHSSPHFLAEYQNADDHEDEDPDLMYRRSRDHFGRWNIQDIVTHRELSSLPSSPIDKKGSKETSERKSRFDIFRSRNGATESDKKISRSKYKSRDDFNEDENENENEGEEEDEDEGSSNTRNRKSDSYSWKLKSSLSMNKKKNGNSLSPEEEVGGVPRRRSKSSPVREIDSGINSPRYDEADREKLYNRSSRNNNNNKKDKLVDKSSVEDIANYRLDKNRRGRSPERRYGYGGANHSPDSHENDKIRLLIDKFKTDSELMYNGDYDGRKKKVEKEEEEEELDDGEEEEEEGEKYSGKIMVTDDDGFGSMDRRGFRNNSIDDYNCKKGSINSRGKIVRSSNSGWRNVDKGVKDSDENFVDRSSDKVCFVKNNGNGKESLKQRRSYVYSGSPDEFDVEIHRYERPKRDSESLRRRSSLKMKEADSRNVRHDRALTPPEERRTVPSSSSSSSLFGMKEWQESNKKLASKYPKENSKIRSADNRDNEGLLLSMDNELAGIGEPIRGEGLGESKRRTTYFGDRRNNSPNSRSRLNHRETFEPNRIASKHYSTESVACGGVNTVTTERRTGMRIEPAVTIRIRNAMTDDERFEKERKVKRNVFTNEKEKEEEGEEKEETRGRNRRKDDEDEYRKKGRRISRDKDWTSASTPSRKIWNYREGGAKITDIDDGQPCLKCGDTCSGFLQHPWRKNCNSCKCPREAHDVCHEEWVSVRSRLGLKGDGATGSVACDPREMGLAWAPPGLPSYKVEEYFSMLPERSVPRLGTPGERYRDRQLAMQLPKQDLAKAYCRHLASEHYTSADDFMAARNEIALDIGTVLEVLESGANCAGCNESLKYGSLAVSAGKLGELYHPGCFQCVQCRELLVDLAYCVYNDAVYCERHYAERLKGRCAACDELIFSGEFTRAMNKDWHSGHFCCWQCDESLTGQRYVLRDEHPYCIKCYESVFANGCEECSKIIGIDSKDLSYKDKHWHEACFLCNKCRVSLVDKQFGSKVDKIYCGNCYDAQFASRCDGCGEIFRAGTKKMEYKTRQWHEKCFCCVVCKNPIGTKSFIPREQEIYCAGCYEDKFATRCVKCNKIITSGGVTYKNEPWHRECFTCSNCSTSLAGQRFTSRDEKPYCAECFGELFAKRCTACTKPITGIGGTRFISFEDRHWHNDCFICAGCKTSLVGHGFITDGDDIICPECAKQKLM